MLCSVLLSPTTHTSLHAAPSPLSPATSARSARQQHERHHASPGGHVRRRRHGRRAQLRTRHHRAPLAGHVRRRHGRHARRWAHSSAPCHHRAPPQAASAAAHSSAPGRRLPLLVSGHATVK